MLQIGEQVRCIDSYGTHPQGFPLTTGEIYTIEWVSQPTGCYVIVNDCSGEYSAERFVSIGFPLVAQIKAGTFLGS